MLRINGNFFKYFGLKAPIRRHGANFSVFVVNRQQESGQPEARWPLNGWNRLAYRFVFGIAQTYVLVDPAEPAVILGLCLPLGH
jgi:hypothetical protein